MDINRHSKNSKELPQASDESWSADVQARKNKREPTIFINYFEKVTVSIIRFQCLFDASIWRFKWLSSLYLMSTDGFVKLRFMFRTHSASFSHLSYLLYIEW